MKSNNTRRATLLEMCRRHAPRVVWADAEASLPLSPLFQGYEPTPDAGPTVRGTLRIDDTTTAELRVVRFVDTSGEVLYKSDLGMAGTVWAETHIKTVVSTFGATFYGRGRTLRRVLRDIIGEAQRAVGERDDRMAIARTEAPEHPWRIDGLSVVATLDTPNGVIDAILLDIGFRGGAESRLWLEQVGTAGSLVGFDRSAGESVRQAVAFGLGHLAEQRAKILDAWKVGPSP